MYLNVYQLQVVLIVKSGLTVVIHRDNLNVRI